MNKLFPILFLAPILLAAQAQTAPKKAAAAAQPVIVTPDKIQWMPAPPILASGAQIAVLAGDPGKPGLYILRLKLPDGFRIMPHWHPTAENVTVISGEFHVGMGDKFDESSMVTLPAGSVGVVPPHHNHYAMAKGETIVQVHGIGPFKLTYVNPADDPSKGQASSSKKAPATKKK